MSFESVEILFSQHNVEEIRDVEKKTRQEIETKKEDLRQMVGERYRDLIEAADTIAEMKKCANCLQSSVKSLQQYTDCKFDQSVSKNRQSTYSVKRYMEISAQVKMIMEVSETIWSRIENGNMIEATHLYLQSLQVLKNLNLDGSTTYCPVLSWFPVLGQQAQALDNLKTTLLNECQSMMADEKLGPGPLSEAICSTILLKNSNLKLAFEEFMNIRLLTITSKFQSSGDMGAAKLSKAVALAISTLKQVNILFVSSVDVNDDKKPSKYTTESDVGLVQHVLKKSYESFLNSTGMLNTFEFTEEKLWMKYLPDSVAKLTTKMQNEENILSVPELQTTCKKWLSDCEGAIKTGALDVLLYVNSFRGLNTLRETIREALEDDVIEDNKSEEDIMKVIFPELKDDRKTEWGKACSLTLGHKYSLWDSVLKKLFLDKVKSLCEKLFSDLVSNAKENISCILKNLYSDDTELSSICEFIWSESASDIPLDTAWKQLSLKKSKEINGGLGMKALTITPTLHNACQQLNGAMKQAISDLANYVPDVLRTGKDSSRKSVNQGSAGCSLSSDERSLVYTYFQDACSGCLKELVQIFEGYASCYSGESNDAMNHMREILFLSNFCQNFGDLCGEFRNGCSLSQMSEEIPFKRSISSSMSSSVLIDSLQPKVSPVWEDMRNSLLQESKKLLKIWLSVIVKEAIIKFRTSMLDFESPLQFFDTLACWDNIKIEEESESGVKVESEILLPLSPSWPVQELLFCVCDSISNVGGHSFTKSMFQELTLSLLEGILHTFIDLKSTLSQNDLENSSTLETSKKFPVTQSWALQKLFDLRVSHGILSSITSDTSNREDQLYEVPDNTFSDLVDWLEGYIDPFDLDVFTPYFTKNVQRSIHGSRSLYGFLMLDKPDIHQPNPGNKSGNNCHNILPLIPDCPRFACLPVSAKMIKQDKLTLPASVKNNLPLASALKQLTEAEQKMEGGRKQSLYSKLGALSSSWLSSVTSEN